MIALGACKERVHLAPQYEQIMNLPEMALKTSFSEYSEKLLQKWGRKDFIYVGGAEVRGVEMKVAPFQGIDTFYS